VVLVEMREHFGVAAAGELVTARPEVLAQRVVVVDLAVLGAPDAAALVRERLVAALDVDDRQPAGAERAAGVDDEPGVVGAAIFDQLRHPPQDGFRQRRGAAPVDTEGSGDPAHW
jgi:hypothetical protein